MYTHRSVSTSGNLFHRIWSFYRDGFREMTVGRILWVLILIKLFVLFFVLKLFFFPDFLSLQGNDSDESRAAYVGNQLVERNEK